MSPVVASKRNYLREITNMYIRESFERTSKENNCKRVWIFAIRNGHCKCCSSFIHFFCPNSEHLSNLLSQSDRCRRNLINCTNFDSIRNGTIQRFRFTYRLPLQRYCYLQATFIPISCFVACRVILLIDSSSTFSWDARQCFRLHSGTISAGVSVAASLCTLVPKRGQSSLNCRITVAETAAVKKEFSRERGE